MLERRKLHCGHFSLRQDLQTSLSVWLLTRFAGSALHLLARGDDQFGLSDLRFEMLDL
jgi:hypothetical protein